MKEDGMRTRAKRLAALLAGGLLALAALAAPAAPAEEPKRLRAQVLKVYDGSSFLINPGMRGTLTGVSTPPQSARGGVESAVFLRQLLEGKTVLLEVDQQLLDPSGQAQYYAFLEDGTFVNALVLIRGYGRAVIKHPNVRYRDHLIEAERTAKAARRGVWGDEFPDPKSPAPPPRPERFPVPPFRRFP